MALIRSKQAAALSRDAVVLDLGDLARQGQAIREKAQRDAERLLADARTQARRIVEEATHAGREEGVQQGLTEGREKGRAEGRAEALNRAATALRDFEAAWQQALDEFTAARHAMLVEFKTDVVRLALAIARRVVRRAAALDPTVVHEQIEAALQMVARKTAVSVFVSPRDLDLAGAILPSLKARFQDGVDLSLAADESIAPGGCIVRAGSGEIDATLATQLDRIAEALLPGQTAGAGWKAAPESDEPSEGTAP